MTRGAGAGALGYIGIGVTDMGAWADFAGLLGLMEGPKGPDGSVRYRMDDQAWRIALHPSGEDDCLYLGFDCGAAAGFEAILAQLSAVGLPYERDCALAEARGVMELARLADPDGVPIELHYGPRAMPEVPFRSPQPIDRFMTGANGLGHVIVNASNPSASLDFYTRVLGMALSDSILFEPAPGVTIPLVFLHCNERHHTIAIAPEMPGGKRVHHLMLEVPSMDEVGRALDRAMAAGLEISATLGRHSNDRMISFYVRTPSGFEVEYGWDGLAVERETWTVTNHSAISVWGHHREHI